MLCKYREWLVQCRDSQAMRGASRFNNDLSQYVGEEFSLFALGYFCFSHDRSPFCFCSSVGDLFESYLLESVYGAVGAQ